MKKLNFKSKEELATHKKNIISSVSQSIYFHKTNYSNSLIIFVLLMFNLVLVVMTSIYILTAYTPKPATFMLNKDNTLISIPPLNEPNKCDSDIRQFVSSFMSDTYNYSHFNRQSSINRSISKYISPSAVDSISRMFIKETRATKTLKSSQGRSGFKFTHKGHPETIKRGIMNQGSVPHFYWMLKFAGRQIITPTNNGLVYQQDHQNCVTIVMRDSIATFENGISIPFLQCFNNTTDVGKKISEMSAQLTDTPNIEADNFNCSTL